MQTGYRHPLPSPFLLPVVAWCLGITLARHFVFGLLWPFYLALSLLISLALFLPKQRIWFILIAFVLLGTIRYEYQEMRHGVLKEILINRHRIVQELEFEVYSQVSDEYQNYEVRTQRLAGQPLKERILLYSTNALNPGSHYRAVVELRPIIQDKILDTGRTNYAAKAYIRQSLQELSSHRNTPKLARVRSNLLKNLERKLGDSSSLAKTLLFSDSSGKKPWVERLNPAGLTHLVAVSGLHVGFIYLILMVVLNLFLPRRWSEICFLFLITIFAALNHWHPPISRAILMIALFLIANWMSRPVSPAQVISLSLFIITLVQPEQLFSIGLQLSYTAVMVIFYVLPLFPSFSAKESQSWLEKIAGRALDYLILSFLVSLAILPFTLHYFGRGTLNGVIANLLGIPVISVMVPLSFLILFVPSGTILFDALLSSYNWLYSFFAQWADFCARLPLDIHANLPPAWIWALIILIATSFLILRKRFKLLKRLAIPAAVLVLLLLLQPFMSRSDFRIIVFDTGVADCIYLQMGDKKLMIDTGPAYLNYGRARKRETQDNWMQRKGLSWLGRNRIRELDYLFLSHLDSDHAGGVESLVMALKIKNIVISRFVKEHPLWQKWEETQLFGNARLTIVPDTMSILLPQARIKILHPDCDYNNRDENNSSLVLRIDHKQKSYLFAADIEAEAEEYLLQNHPSELKSDYLKVPHHGSPGSSTEAFILQVDPREVWISSSRFNHYNFPGERVLNLFDRYGIPVKMTADGSIHHP
ncbi:MAG: DNA internalization-related competence protein ComEC/Rec2 [Candidatus Cloacimonetes bacterium]|nr:DNA internalization-related competence protein ComEC/Rec2 [Candidatus Cloacimonadota bacterium]